MPRTKLNAETKFLANLIATNHANCAAKLRGLRALVGDGHEIRSLPFSVDRIVIDGRVFGMEVLESPAVVGRWLRLPEAA